MFRPKCLSGPKEYALRILSLIGNITPPTANSSVAAPTETVAALIDTAPMATTIAIYTLPKPRKQRSLEDLKQFKEVKFI